MPYFLQSCRSNPGFHWKLFTDCDLSLSRPSNVDFLPFTFQEFSHLADEKLGESLSLSHAYKLCDLKPAYGHLFEDELNGFDFWGYTDLDLIYGDLSRFVSPSILHAHDVISSRANLVNGHFSLFRNGRDLRLAYRSIPTWLPKFSSEKYENFDEGDFDQYIVERARRGDLRLFRKDIQADDNLMEYSGRKSFVMEWNQGRIRDLVTRSELAYFHFIESKYHDRFVAAPLSQPPPSRFLVRPSGIKAVSGFSGRVEQHLICILECLRATPWHLKRLLRRMVPDQVRTKLRAALSR